VSGGSSRQGSARLLGLPADVCSAAGMPSKRWLPHLFLPSAAPSLWLSSDTRASRPHFCSRSARASASRSAARDVAASSASRCLASS
jgi:hypothetical protein